MLNDYNVKAVNDAYKNAHIAMQSISDLLPEVKDEGIKRELEEEFKGYETHINNISAFMKENEIEPQDINAFKKAIMKGSIKMKTFFDDSKNQLADIMLKGMGRYLLFRNLNTLYRKIKILAHKCIFMK